MMLVPTPHPNVLVGNRRQVSNILGKYVFSKLYQQLKCGRGNLAEYVTSCSCRVRCAQHFLSICSHVPFFCLLQWKRAYPTDNISYSSQRCWVAPFFACLYQAGSWYRFSVIWYYLSFMLPDGYQMGNCSQCFCCRSTPEPMGMGLSVSCLENGASKKYSSPPYASVPHSNDL